VNGTGFSLAATVTVDGNICTNPQVTNFSSITCTVPATAALNNIQVTVTVIDGSNTANASSQFTYNVTNTPNIVSSGPSVFTVAGGQLNISGTLFGNGSVSVSIGSTQASVVLSSPTNMIAILPILAPGIYPVMVFTANGYARPPIQIEYRLYVQQVSPQVGSLYGGTNVYVQGQGFDNTTSVNFVGNNVSVPCTVISFQATEIYCQTTAAAPQITITSNGVDPVNGVGFAWSPQYATVQVGAVVQWQWGSSALLSSITYKVQQVDNGYSTTPSIQGFDSGATSASGKEKSERDENHHCFFYKGTFSYQFQTPGTYYYWSTPVDQSGQISLRGVINVVAAQPQTLTVQVTSQSVTGE
jgi:plastocyanin